MRLFYVIVLVTLITVGCRTHDDAQFEIKRANAETPSEAKSISGSYYRGDGTGYNIYLILKPNGTYVAEWHGCLGKYGDASGTWGLDGSRITFFPSSETEMMKDHLKTLEVMRFDRDWVLLPTDKEDREFYDTWGVSRYSCFQKKHRVK